MRAMSSFAALFLLLIAALTVANTPTQPPKKAKVAGPLTEARQRLMKGNHEEARQAYTEAAKKDAKLRPACAIGIARSYVDSGDSAKAMTTITEALQATPADAELNAYHAHLLFERGQWPEATTAANKALAKNPDQLLAKWTTAQVLDAQGDMDGADKIMRSIVRYYTARSNADQDITDPDELLVVAQAGAANARRYNLPKQFSFILNEVLSDALKAEPDFWPAEIMAGTMLLEKYNRPTAVEAFDKALVINPKCADAFVGKAMAAMMKFDVKECENAIEQALKLNANHTGALQMKASIDLMAGDWVAAEKALLAAKATNPRDAAMLGKLAAVYRLQNKLPAFDAVVQDAESFDKKPATFYSELGNALEERKRYSLAETFYKKAIEARANYAPPRNALGMLQLRLGNEAEGRDLLTKAFTNDPFNVRTANTLKVLKHLEGYAVKQTAHYEIRFDLAHDKILIDALAELLEETHAELKAQFQYEPPTRVLIEVFNSHDMFSGRTTGLPDLHTIGACTGKVVVMASPTAKGLKKPFHWGRVIRHEITHIFNLVQTDYQCPHWLTEGLAVRNENMALSPNWLMTLRDRLEADTLFNLDTVLYGFVRPKTPDEWGLAYCQSKLYVDYAVKTHGEAVIAKLLAAYQANKTTAEAITAACGVDQATFEKGYKAYVAGVVKPYQRKGPATRVTKPLTFEELEKLYEAEPDNHDIAAMLAELLIRREKAGEAKKILEKVLEKEKDHAPSIILKSRLLARAGEDDAAKELLRSLRKSRPDDPRAIGALVRMYTEAKQLDEAAELLEHARKVVPLDGDWLNPLAAIYKETENTAKLIDVLKEIISHDPDELDGRVRLAKVSLEAKDYPQAEKYAKDALQIDVMHEEARKLLLDALKAQDKKAEIEKLQKRYVLD
jgi:cellulose synthase operon protein C